MNDGLPRDVVFADVIVPTLCPNATLLGAGNEPALAWNGTTYAVAYRNPNDIIFASISAAGVPAAPTVVRISPSFPGAPRMVWRAPNWLLGFSGGGVFLQQVDPSGSPVGAPVDVDGGNTASEGITFATGGGPLRILWGHYMSSALQRYTGEVQTNLTIANPVQLAGNGTANGVLAWNGADWKAIWDAARMRMTCVEHSLETLQVTATGAVAGGGVVRAYLFNCSASGAVENHAPQLFWNGTDYTAVWDPVMSGTPPTPTGPISVARFSTTISTPMQLTTSDFSYDGSAVWTGSELGVAWAGGGIFITRADASGNRIGETTIDDVGENPSLVWDGSRYAVAYERDGNIYFARTCP